MSENTRRKEGSLDIPIIAIVASIFVILLLFVGIAIAGSIFLWGWEPFEGDESDPGTVKVFGEIIYSETDEGMINTLTIMVLNDTVDWKKFQVRIDGNYLPLHSEVDEEGDYETFTWTVPENNVNERVKVMIVNVDRNSVAWEKEIVVKQKNEGIYIESINIRAGITYNASSEGSENTITFEILSGTVDWSRYEVQVDGIPLYRSTDVDLAGDTESFSWAQNESNVGQRIHAKIRNIEKDKVIWMSEIIVRGA